MKTNNYTRFLVPLPQWRWMCSLLVLLGLSMTVTRAQLAINYPLTVSSGTYSSISGTGTPLTGAVLLDTGGENITGLPPFTVNSVAYNNARVCSNGWVALYASTAPTSTASTGLSTTITNAGAVFAPMSADLAPSNAASVAFYYQVIGNEIIFEWVNYSRYSGSGSNDILNYQVRLNTSTSAVAFVYGTCTAGTNPTSSPQVGWKTGAGTTWATDINNLMIDITGSPNTCSWADAVTGNANSSGMYIRNTAPTVGPASGLTYTWTPQASPAPVRTFAAPASITASGATVSWTAPSGAAQYNVQYRTVGSCSWTNWSGNPTTSAIAALTGLNAGTSYQVRVQAQTTGGAASSIWSHVAGTTAGTGINGYTATGTFTTLPTCFPATALTATPSGLQGANISWTAPVSGTPIGYEYAVTTSSTPPVSGTFNAGTSTSVGSLTGSTYYLHVRTDCGAGDYSSWATSAAFYPTQPNQIGTGGTVSSNLPLTSNYGFNYSQQIYTAAEYTTAVGAGNTFITKIRFYYNGTGSGVAPGASTTTTNFQDWVIYMGNTTKATYTSTTDWVPVGSLSQVFNGVVTFPTPGTWMEITLSTPFIWNGTDNLVVAIDENTASYGALTYYRAFTGAARSIYYRNDATNPDPAAPPTANSYTSNLVNQIQFEASAPPSCFPVSSPTASGVTHESANISWGAPSPAPGFGYEYAVNTSPTPPADTPNTGTDIAGTSTSVGSLSGSTTYYLHVRSECIDGTDYSTWSTYSFITPCTPIASFPWNDGFESLSGIGTSTYPSCWYEQNGDWQSANAGSVTAHDPRTGTYYIMNSWTATNEFMWTPTFTLTGGTSYDFSFYWSGDGVAGWTGDVFYNSSQTSVGATQLGGSFITSGTAAPANSYSQVVSTFTPPSTGTYAFAIRINATVSPNYIAFDDFAVELTPACPKPTALSAAPALNSASLDWTENGPATEWEIQYQSGGNFTPTTPNVLGIISHPYTLGSLTGLTTYTYYVRGNCGVDGPSAWAGPFTFTTLPCIPTYTTGKTVGDLLSRVAITGTTLDNNSGTAEVNPSYTFFTGQPQYTATLAAGTSYDIEVSIGTWGNQGVAVWIDFDNDGAFETPSERIGFTTGTFGVGTGSLPIDPANTTSFPISLPCDPIPGTYTMRVRDVYNTGGQLIDPCANYGFGETEDYLITVAPPPPCPSVGLANVQAVTYNSVTLDWNQGCTETQWDVHVVPAGGGLSGAPNNGGITAHPTTIPGLTASTAYHYYVRADCGGPVSAWVGPYSFTTPATPPANDECASATAFGTILADQNCVTVTATTVGATGSADATCTGTEDDDVWYTFTVPSGYSSLLYTNTTITGSTDRVLQVFDACGGTSLGCYNGETGTLTGLTGGSTYRLRAYTWGSGVTATFSICLRTPPPPPANDDCATATTFPTIPTNGTCASITVNTAGASGSADATCNGDEDDDVWYTFTVPAGNTTLLYANTNISGSADRMLQILDACGGANIGCYDNESGVITGLTGGATYKLRVYSYFTTSTQFSLCLRVPPPAPANNECGNAVALTVNPTFSCASSATGYTASATESTETAPTCSATGVNDDVWFKFTATGSDHRITLTNISVTEFSSMAMAVYSGSCGSLVEVQCVTGNTLNLTGLTPQEYHVRVYTSSTSATAFANAFTICVGTPPPPPVNNDCSGTIALTVGVAVNGYTNSATESEPSFLCDGFTGNADDDVWYSFVAPAYPVNISVSGMDAVIDLRQGGSCGSSTTIDCSDDGINSEVLEQPALTAGQTYYVRVYSWGGPTAQGAFTILINSALSPTNNEPGPSTPTINSANFVYPNCASMAGTTVGSSSSYGDAYNDVWYSFTAISNGVSVKMLSDFCDNAITLYSSNFTELSHEDVVGEGDTEIMNYGLLTTGQTYYLAISNNTNNGTDGPFTLCIQKLAKPTCGAATYNSLCSVFNPVVNGAATRTSYFTDVLDNTVTQVNTPGPVILGNTALGLQYGHSYNVSVTANYNLYNGNGLLEPIAVSSGNNACSITITAAPKVVVKANQRCSTGAVLYRNSYLQGTPVGASNICGVTGYQVEFIELGSCDTLDVIGITPIVKAISSPSATISLSYAFNGLIPLSTYTSIGHWKVRWRPIFGSHPGSYGTSYAIAVNGTAAAGMLEEPGDDMNGLENTGSTVAANLYPNPNNGDMVNLNMTGITSDNVFVRIMDGMGRVVYTNRYTVDGSLNTIVTFSKPLANGLYMVEFTTGNDVITQRMMVTK